MQTTSPIRSSGFIWIIRILQVIFAIALLVITVQDASVWHSLNCTTPTKLAYHVAMAAITLFPLAYFLLSTGPVSLTKFWSPWTQIIFDIIFIVFWIVAAALSSYDCDGLCYSCSAGGAEIDLGAGFAIWAGSLTCDCVFDDDLGGSGDSKLLLRASRAVKAAEKATTIAAKKGLDAAMIFLFFVTLFTAIYLKYGPSPARAQTAANADAGRVEAKIFNDVEMDPRYAGAHNEV